MVRAMYSAISGMLNHQLRMDVLGNDIANVNTVGYKNRRTTFHEAFAQATRTASDAKPVGLSVGLGSVVNSTETSFTQGAFQRTDLETDVAIGGDGFFTVTAESDSTGERYFTRAGNFILDKDGYLRTTDGNYLQGTGTFGATVNSTDVNVAPGSTPVAVGSLSSVQIPSTIADVGETVANWSIGTDGAITVVGEAGTPVTIGYLTLADFQNDNGLAYRFNSYFTNTQASGTPAYYQPQEGPVGTTQSGALELSNVDIATEFADMIITQRGFDANARTISTTDEMLQTAVSLKR